MTYARGGLVPRPRPYDDRLPVVLSPGYVHVSPEAARHFSRDLLRKLNEGRLTMATSQNGFLVIFSARTSGPPPRLRKFNIPGTNRTYYFRDGSAGFLLAHAVLYWHEKVEPISVGIWDEWGWAVRPVRGQISGYSNHASGTAADVNATKHPLGIAALKSFTKVQIARLHHKVLTYRGCVRWGGEYEGRPDSMHIEINASLPECEKRARALMKTKRGQRILAANPGLKAVIES